MSVRISLILEASEMVLSLHMISAVVWAIREKISGFDPITPSYLKLSTSSSLWPFILISLWKPFGLFVITFFLSGPISILYLVMLVSRRSTRTPTSPSSSYHILHLRNIIYKAEVGNKSFFRSDTAFMVIKCFIMILSRKMLKRVDESRHAPLSDSSW